jgi:hypothetical protein
VVSVSPNPYKYYKVPPEKGGCVRLREEFGDGSLPAKTKKGRAFFPRPVDACVPALLWMGCAGSRPADGSADKAVPADDPQQARKNAAVSEPTKVHSLSSASHGISLRYSCISERGYNPEDLFEANQDAYLASVPVGAPHDDLLLSVFDGHGEEGTACAQFCKREVAKTFGKLIAKFPDDTTVACKEAMLSLNLQLRSCEEADAAYSGATAIIAWFRGQTLHVCNVGDCRAVLGERRGKQTIAYAMSVDHTPCA